MRCQNCGIEFAPYKPLAAKTKFCSNECRNTIYHATCLHCGREFRTRPPTARAPRHYCSNDCRHQARFALQRKRGAEARTRRQAEKEARLIGTCTVCGVRFRGSKTGQLCCSRECNNIRGDDIRRIREGSDVRRICKDCGAEIPCRKRGDGPGNRTARCAPCNKRYYQEVQKKHEAARRARKRGASAEVFNPLDVFERDSWRCQLCGCKTPKRLRGTHNVPLAKGGDHTRQNCQCACRRCNQDKSDRIMGQLRLCA